ncbi:Cof-type HAD-IIB family hydrolase [Alicyclobacillus acidiphilus]|uniref:Cof-type HAD-IIB family hydrolase n=1 Tax=Alicyclobacillus acidiphilus TaxID=182455 RepID=UPI000834DA6F|nr:Cof-type HAD-IIB family hydrolase [Alicyclobacillus acidiphilus]
MSRRESDIEMVFLDIDGTLYTDGQIVERSARAVAELLAQDIPVAVCTGRSLIHAQHIQDELRVPYGIYFNGGLVKTGHRELFSMPFDPDVVQGILAAAEARGISTIIHTHDHALSFEPIPDRFRPVMASYDFPDISLEPGWKHHLSDLNVFQINAFMSKEWDATFESEFPACYIYRWHDEAVDFQRRKSDKSIGALHLLKHLGIDPAKAVHIGDGGNDIGMFKTMGYSYAMGNATDDVKCHAKRVTSSAIEGGVADALIDLGLIG